MFLLPYPRFRGVHTWAGRSCTSSPRPTKVDRRIGLIFYRLQRGCRLFSRSSRRRSGLGGLMLQGLQVLGVGSGRRCRTRRLAHGLAWLRCLFGDRMLNLQCIALLREAADAYTHEYGCNRQRKSHPFSWSPAGNPSCGTSKHLSLDARTLPSTTQVPPMLNPLPRESTRKNGQKANELVGKAVGWQGWPT